jgi:hypothetical protein
MRGLFFFCSLSQIVSGDRYKMGENMDNGINFVDIKFTLKYNYS